jgi:hypothetical protein
MVKFTTHSLMEAIKGLCRLRGNVWIECTRGANDPLHHDVVAHDVEVGHDRIVQQKYNNV